MSQDEELLAIVAALESLQSREETQLARSKWRDPEPQPPSADRKRSWKNS